jgi:hypothetical protein
VHSVSRGALDIWIDEKEFECRNLGRFKTNDRRHIDPDTDFLVVLVLLVSGFTVNQRALKRFKISDIEWGKCERQKGQKKRGLFLSICSRGALVSIN